MNTKLILATVAALGFATSAFASDGGQHDPFVFQAAPLSVTTSSGQALSQNTFDAAPVLQDSRNEGAVESYNSLPKGFYQGTLVQQQATAATHYFADQGDHRFAGGAIAGGNG